MSMSKPKNPGRRRFVLRSLAGSLALPGLPSLMADTVDHNSPVQSTRGAGTGARRFVAVGNLLGFQQKHFFPETPGREFEETTLLKPLAENREHINIYRGLDHGIRGGHFAVHTFLSGVLHHESKNRRDGNVTIDQFLADEIGKQTRFASLTVGSEGGIHGGCQMSWTKSGVRVPPITGPAELFDRLFMTESQQRRSQMINENALQASILDSITEEAGSLSKRVNQEDRSKLDEYFSSIREVEKQLEVRRRWADQPKPEAPFEKPANTNTVDDLPMLYELIALALQTDSTRIATLEIGGSFLPQNLGIDKSYHSLSHHGNDEETIAHLITLETYQLEQFGKFLTRLMAIQDGEQTLLDSTAVLFGSGMGNGSSHTNSDLPIVLAGGGYGRGEFKKVGSGNRNQVPLCNLYVDIAQKMGVQTESFGTSTGSFS
ncbi:MAG TPA: DUF1552 domain-containing protein [Rhodopirellula baltica]|uniref:Secreted protein containing DUF1552 n=1 Tax=Rhodopirellula baltica (strain DSM 10527 / NCIMB 13988 / SH1) TaxID=243090 RepID=Q7UIH2_RHOBA|nr:DUF1552 domain-containing protein [Rhodopirellula baltica]CAD77642.1 hypothetical protein-signal peptide prediction [Rhodopirellula baltica SH 1]HBE62308.1 DUF1552 domain-containing protein [Rhodopirellula baltica]